MNFFYISTGGNYPPDKPLLDGLRGNGHDISPLIFDDQKHGRYLRFTKHMWEDKRPCDIIIVGYSLPILVPFVRFFSRKNQKKIVFSAISSQYESNIIARKLGGPRSLMAMKWWLTDFFAFHFSSQVLLESNAQINFIHKLFFVPRKKMTRSWMGVDEEVFSRDASIKKKAKFTVLFRGRFLPESGILTIIEAAKILENQEVQFRIIGEGFMYREVNALMDKLKPKNIEFINKKLSNTELRTKMLECHVSLGQLADHPRLSRTLPCKLFESLALGLPYLTGRNAGALELLKEDETCFAVNPGDAHDLANKILFLKEHQEILKKIGENGHALYKEKFTSKILTRELIERL